MVAHDGVGQHINGENRSQSFHPPANRLAAKGVIFAGSIIDASQKSTANATLDSVHDADFGTAELLRSFRSAHSDSPESWTNTRQIVAKKGQGVKIGGWHVSDFCGGNCELQ
jgi:hypothetical protein